MAAARLHRPGNRGRSSPVVPILFWSLLSLLPDADVVGFSLGVQYGDPWGHRGATHSMVFSAAVGLALGFASLMLRLPVVRTSLLGAAVVASHALLDTLTDGGLDVRSCGPSTRRDTSRRGRPFRWRLLGWDSRHPAGSRSLSSSWSCLLPSSHLPSGHEGPGRPMLRLTRARPTLQAGWI
jgi:hypothetical protein